MSGRREYWDNVGEQTFRDIGQDTRQAPERYGFRIFKVILTTSRGESVKIAGEVHRRPLHWVDHPMNGRLTSPYREYLYSPGVNVAACQPYGGRTHDRAPALFDDGKPHGCGFYAYGSTDHPDAQVPENRYTKGISVHVNAVVAGSGRRIVGSAGFLSEKLRIVALAFPLHSTLSTGAELTHAHDLFAPRLERLIPTHYPDVAIFDSVERMVSEFPLTALPEKPATPAT